MNYVMDALRKRDNEKKVPVIRMEIDYQLMTLFDAIQAKDKAQMKLSKEKLENLRKEFVDVSA